MTPDEQWQHYKDSGQMTYDLMFPETRQAIRDIKIEIGNVISELKEEHIDPIKKDLAGVEVELKNKVSWKTFTWVLSILMGITVGWMGLIWTTLQQLSEKTNNVNYNVGQIQARLGNFEVIK